MTTVASLLLAFSGGAFLWTFSEYLLHRWFHTARGSNPASREHLAHHARRLYLVTAMNWLAWAGVLLVGLVGMVMVIGLLFAAILPFLLSFEGAPLQQYAAPVPDFWFGIVTRLAALLPFIAVPVLMAILARSTGFAFLLILLFFAADVAVTAAPFWSVSPVPWIPALTVSGSISRLLGAPDAPLASLVPAGVSMTALLAWAVLPSVAAISRFRRLDLNE